MALSDSPAPSCLAIIGTAGRNSDALLLSSGLYGAMYEQVLQCIDDWTVSAGVSGMAAYADHLAVRAFLGGKLAALKLFAPAPWDGRQFRSTPEIQFNPGTTSNRYHQAFSRTVGIDSLAELAEAIRRGAVLEVHPGFHRRNDMVARHATHMIALTFGTASKAAFGDVSTAKIEDGGTVNPGSGYQAESRRRLWVDFSPDDPGFRNPKQAGLRDGGTAQCWGECWRAEIKRHVNLNQLACEFALDQEPKASCPF